jgi:hypothetical protein
LGLLLGSDAAHDYRAGRPQTDSARGAGARAVARRWRPLRSAQARCQTRAPPRRGRAPDPTRPAQIRREAAAQAEAKAAELEAARQRALAEAAKYERKQRQLKARRFWCRLGAWAGVWRGAPAPALATRPGRAGAGSGALRWAASGSEDGCERAITRARPSAGRRRGPL